MAKARRPSSIPSDYPSRIQRLRVSLGLTQSGLSERLGVTFVTVNRWENGKSRPSPLSWGQIEKLAESSDGSGSDAVSDPARSALPPLVDFTCSPEIVRALAEGERLSFGHMANPAFATEVSRIDPLPHQRIAVYDQMLRQDRLRFLLADDAGAGKTIMAGLYIREMLSRRLLRRVLIVPPAGLVGNWQRELATLFNLPFRIVQGQDARNENPFADADSDRVIVSVDTLAGSRMFSRLREPNVAPYDLVIFDEAHKLSADRTADLRVRKTGRYKLAEALAGVPDRDAAWQLPRSAHHLLLLTATPHMGKDYPYYALWRLLDPSVLSTPEAFQEYPREGRARHFLRRTKEEMVFLDGRRMYPTRISDTLGYELTQGEVSEQALYDQATDYLQFIYNKAKLLNREAARLAMSVFQRRLASSTWALLRSFERRLQRLDELIDQVQQGRLSTEQLAMLQRRLSEDDDVLESKTADEETTDDDREENEVAEDRLMQGVIATSLADLVAEREQVQELHDLAQKVYDHGHESKFDKLREIATDPQWADEKLIVFTEHRDTLDFLIRRLGGLGYTGQIAQIHGGMHYTKRQEQIERFRTPSEEGGARFMICTDAAAEGVNLQFCWLMINYDVPWNPARLEQRMGRIHRYGQKHDPVIILNLVAPKTREGRVLKTLLDKLETIRKELKSDKVFDSIGRMFQDVSIKQYMERAITGSAEDVAEDLDGRLTKEQIEALTAREESLYGVGGDVKEELPRLKQNLEQETYLRLLPGYVRQFIQNAAPLIDIQVEGSLDGPFSLRPGQRGAIDPLLPTLEEYPDRQRQRFTVVRPTDQQEAVWLHPGEPIFETLRSIVSDRLGHQARRGAVFVNPTDERPYLFHLALLSVVRQADPEIPELAHEEPIECRLVGVKQYEGADIHICPVEHLLLLRGGSGMPAIGQRLAAEAVDRIDQAKSYLAERVARHMATQHRDQIVKSLPERERFVKSGFDFREAELATARAKLAGKARSGNRAAQQHLGEVKQQQRELGQRRDEALRLLRREPELIAPAGITFITHALVVPSDDPADREQHEANVERIAMELAWAYEESSGAIVRDVHTPELAREAGLGENPGFDLLSIHPSGEKRCIEVKGRAAVGEVEVSHNEWARACNLRDEYWLYVVYNCATDRPDMRRIQNPFVNVLIKAKGSVLVSPQHVLGAASGEHQ